MLIYSNIGVAAPSDAKELTWLVKHLIKRAIKSSTKKVIELEAFYLFNTTSLKIVQYLSVKSVNENFLIISTL